MRTMNKNNMLGEPTIQAPAGRAWRYTDADHEAIANGKAHAIVAAWLVEAPWAHPFWHSYYLVAYHLRQTKGIPPARIHLPDATHEVCLAALHPDWRPAGMTDNPAPHMLHSLNFVAQFAEPSDAAAAARIARCVEEIVAGVLSPDTDYVRQWVARFGDNMLRNGATAGRTKVVIAGGGAATEVVIDPKPADAKPDTSGGYTEPGGAK